MAITGHMPQAIALAALSTIFVAGIDNVIRPFFVLWGKLELSPFVVMVSVFGGLAAVGPWGMLLGPIIVRLALEVLRISREEHVL
jgi:predicted PurR-regulated permease PerM